MAEMGTSIQMAVRSTLHDRYLRGRERAYYGYERGSVAIISAFVMVGLVAFCGLALDMAFVYNRQAELRNVSDAAALAAARRLNGTAAGIDSAVAAAAAMATAQQYQYGSATVEWSPSAITFSTSPDRNGTWVDAGAAAAAPERMMFARIDTAEFTGSGDVQTVFMPIVSSALATVTTHNTSVAGRTVIDALPLAICAQGAAASSRANDAAATAAYVELVEYGFRRGVSYDLMNLNPYGSTPANFVVNPVAPPGQAGLSTDVQAATVGPYVCNGTLGIPRLSGDTIAIAAPFPLGSLYKQLNSRFDQYEDNLCNFHGAPPDANIQPYVFSNLALPATGWMTFVPAGQTAAPTTGSPLQTYAELGYSVGTAAQYGPLWAYAKAVKFSSYVPGSYEPAAGYPTMPTSVWSTLYRSQTARAAYPSTTPYRAATGVNFAPPSTLHKPGTRGRRVLNVPLLSCSTMPTSSATVLAVGKFFMTVPATSTALAAEFAGAIPLQNVQSHVELFQ